MLSIAATWARCWRRRDRRPIPEWALEHVSLQPPFAKTGPFDCSESRHFIEVFAALQDDAVREVNLLKPVRSGGTTIADVFLPWTIANDPGPCMHAFQADDVAREHANSRTLPTLRRCKGVKDLVPGGKIDTAEIRLLNGQKIYINGPSLANFQTKGIRYLILDEPWMYKAGALEQARARLGDFIKQGTSKLFSLSQGGFPESDWHLQYHSGLVHEWIVPCAHCRQYMLPDFFGQRPDGTYWGFRWNDHRLKNDDWDLAKTLPTLRFECQHCGHPHPLAEERRIKAAWNRAGSYSHSHSHSFSHSHSSRKKSFHWSALIDFPWLELAELWLHACNYARRGILQHKLDFHHKRWARFCSEQLLLEASTNFKRVVYTITDRAPEEAFRFMSIDKQALGFFWWTVRAWSKDGRSWRLGFGSATSSAELEEIRIRFQVEPLKTTIDSRYEPLGDRGVYADCLRYGWIAVKGDKRSAFTHRSKKGSVLRSYSEPQAGDPERGSANQGKRFCAVIFFSVSRMNKKVQELIEAGLWEEPAMEDNDLEAEYNRQMAQRVLRKEFDKKTGELKEYWWSGRNDHARDLANQEALKATLHDILPDELALVSEVK